MKIISLVDKHISVNGIPVKLEIGKVYNYKLAELYPKYFTLSKDTETPETPENSETPEISETSENPKTQEYINEKNILFEFILANYGINEEGANTIVESEDFEEHILRHTYIKKDGDLSKDTITRLDVYMAGGDL